MSHECEFNIHNKCETFTFDKVAKQSNGSVLLKVDKTVILASVVSEFLNPTNEEFTPLTVQYIEKSYSNATITSGYIKREGKSSEFEVLTSRIIDRSLRPLFPDGYCFPTVITIMVLSVQPDADLQVLALNAASAALYYSDLPVKKIVTALRIGRINNNFLINPSFMEQENSTLDLLVSGTKDDLLMIEMKTNSSKSNDNMIEISNTNEIKENDLLEAIKIAFDNIRNQIIIYEEKFSKITKDTVQIDLIKTHIEQNHIIYIRDNYSTEIRNAVLLMSTKSKIDPLKKLSNNILKTQYVEEKKISYNTIYQIVDLIKKEIVRKMILDENIRPDGRKFNEIRPIDIETNILPSTHSSCLFTRGQTQALVVATIGGVKDAQSYDRITSKYTHSEKFMLHYNFPGFCVGEAKPVFGVSRRELGHGNLGKRALESTIDSNYSDTIRLVSEVFESNGSSSMATVCAGSIALKAANIPTSNLVAGIAMGAMIKNDKFSILSDISGLEDNDGDMDLKIAGTSRGITAMQMDVKLNGLNFDILEKTLLQAKNGKDHILGIMEESLKNIETSKALPLIAKLKIDPKNNSIIIGQGGSTIKNITEEFSVKIDINKNNGEVKITSNDMTNINNAVKKIEDILKEHLKNEIDYSEKYKINDNFMGIVQRIVDFGAFVMLPDGEEGLLHVSKISKHKVNNVNDVLDIGQKIDVTIINISKDRIGLVATDTIEETQESDIL